jgi:hypothetical protein
VVPCRMPGQQEIGGDSNVMCHVAMTWQWSQRSIVAGSVVSKVLTICKVQNGHTFHGCPRLVERGMLGARWRHRTARGLGDKGARELLVTPTCREEGIIVY